MAAFFAKGPDLLAGDLNGFSFAAIGPQTAGIPFNVVIMAIDTAGNSVSNYTGTVALTTTAGTINPTTSAAFVSGCVTQQVTVTTAGSSQTITATGSGMTGASGAFTVNPGPLNHFAIGPITSPQVGGTPFPITITAQDANNNTVANFTGSVTFTITPTGPISGAIPSAFVNGIMTNFVSLFVAGPAFSITVTSGTVSATSGTFAVSPGTKVVTWGDNSYGQWTVPNGLSGVTAIAAGQYHSLALKDDGTVVAWGHNGYGVCTVPSGLSGVTAIAAGYAHNLVLKGDGTVVAWGYPYGGVCNVPSGLSGVVSIAGGSSHSLALKNDGTVVTWGDNSRGQCMVPSGLCGVFAIAAGNSHSLALKSDGTIVGWGYNYYGQCTAPSGLSGVTAIAAGDVHSLALKGDGTVVAWGYNGYGQSTVPSGLIGVTAIAAGHEHSLALKGDGTVVAWGRNALGQTTVPNGLNGVTAISAGYQHNAALLTSDILIGFTFSAINSQIAGIPFNVVITAVDGSGNTVSNFTGRVVLTTTAGAITPVISAAFISGIVTQQVTVTAAGPSQTIAATGDGKAGTSGNFDVLPGVFNGFSFAAIGPQTAGTPFNVVITAVDGTGNTVSNFTGTVALTTTAGTITPGTSAAFVSGVVIQQVTVTVAGPSRTITATGSGKTGTSGTFNVLAGAIHGFNFMAISPQTAGIPFNVVITAIDGTGNIVSNFTSTVALTTTAGTITPATTAAFASGIITQQVTVTADGTAQTITATGSGKTGTSGGFTVNPSGTVLDHFAIGPIASPQIGGTPFPITITAQDANNNTVANFTGSVTFTITPTGPISGAIPSAFVNGIMTNFVSLFVAGPAFSITVTSGTVSATSGTFAVSPGTKVVTWGDNSYGQWTVPNGLSGVTAIAAGQYHSLALKDDGTVVAWGHNGYGVCTVPSGLSGVTAIAAGYAHNLVLKGDGTVVAWGYPYGGVCNVPSGLSGVVSIAGGSSHSLALKNDGTVVTWGDNSRGQCMVPSGLCGVFAIAAGNSHSLALKSDGTIVGWGYNYYGQCTAPSGLSGVTAIAAGDVHSLALKGDGTVVAWGYNGYGQSTVPSGLIGVTAIAAGHEHSLALKGDGTVVAWGRNALGQTTVPNGLNGVTAISAGYQHNAALLTSDILIGFTFSAINSQIAGIPFNVVITAVDGSGNTVSNFTGRVVLTTTAGTITPVISSAFVSGSITQQVTATIAGPSQTITAIGGGKTGTSGAFTVNPGTLNHFAIGPITSPQTGGTPFPITITAQDANNNTVTNFTGSVTFTITPTGPISATIPSTFVNGIMTNLVSLFVAGSSFSITVTGGAVSGTSGTFEVESGTKVVTWGNNGYGQCTVPSGLSGVTAISASGYNCLVLKGDGTIVAWGNNSYGQCNVPSELSGVAAIEGGIYHNLALKIDGTVVAWGANSSGETVVPVALSGVRAISAGYRFSLSLNGNGTVVAWGKNDYGQCNVPSGLGGVKSIEAGGYHCLALKGDGTMLAWGLNDCDQSTIPNGLYGVIAIAGGDRHSVALKGDGTVVAWGYNAFGQTTVPSGLHGVTAISAGCFHSLALKEDGTVVAWGFNSAGQSTVPNGLSRVMAISAGWYYNMALLAPDELNGFRFTAIGTQNAGAPFNVVITAVDGSGNTVSNFTGRVALTTTAGTIAPIVSDVFVSGSVTQQVVVNTIGPSQTITATGSGKAGTSGAFIVNPDVLTSAAVVPVSLQTGFLGNVTFNFTTVNPIPAGGQIVVVFPAGFSISGASGTTASSLLGLNGTWTAIIDGQTLILTQTGGTATSSGLKRLMVGGIQNPASTGIYGPFAVTTKTGAGVFIDAGSAPAIPISSGLLTGTSITPASLNAGAIGNVNISFTSATTISIGGKIKVMFPSGFDVSNTVVTATTGLTGTWIASISGQVVTCGQSDGGITAPGAITLTLSGIRNPQYSGNTGFYLVFTTTPADALLDAYEVVPASMITAAPMPLASVTPASLMAGATNTATVSFTSVNPIPADGQIIVIFPSINLGGTLFQFDLANVGVSSASIITGLDGSLSVAADNANHKMTITRSGGTTAVAGVGKTFSVIGIKNPAISGVTGTYGIQTTLNDGTTVIDAGSAPAITITPGLLTGMVMPGPAVSVNVPGTSDPWLAGMPNGSQDNVGTSEPPDVAPFQSPVLALSVTPGQVLNWFASGQVGHPGDIAGPDGTGDGNHVHLIGANNGISDIHAPVCSLVGLFVGGVPGDPAPATLDFSAQASRDYNGICPALQQTFFLGDGLTSSGTVQSLVVSAGATQLFLGVMDGYGWSNNIGSFAVNLAPVLAAGTLRSATICFLASNPLLNNGQVHVTFPAGFDVSGANGLTATALQNLPGTWTAVVNGQTITFTMSNGTDTGPGAKSLTIAGIRNPTAAGTTGTYTITTLTSSGSIIDQGSSVVGPAIPYGQLMATAVIPGSLAAGNIGAAMISFTTVTPIPTGGKISVTFPTGFNVNSADGLTASSLAGLTGTWTAHITGQVVTFAQSGGGPTTPGAISLSIGGIRNPQVSGSTGTYTIFTATSSDALLDVAVVVPTSVITPAVMPLVGVTPASLFSGVTNAVTVSFTNVNPIPNSGKIKVTFPGGFDISGVGGQLASALFNLAGSWTASVNGQTLVLCQTGGTSTGLGAKSLTIGPIRNPLLAGTTGTFTVETTSATDSPIDQGTAPGLNLLPSPVAVTFRAGSTNTSPGRVVTMPIMVAGFSNVISVQFTLLWNPAVLQYTGTGDYGLGGLASGNFGTGLTNQGKLTFSWDDPTSQGVNLADGTTIFSVQFNAVGSSGTNSMVDFGDDPTQREVVDNHYNQLVFSQQSGLVQITKFQLAGMVRYCTTSLGLPGVQVNLSGDDTQSLATASDGTFSFLVNAGGNYQVTPSLVSDARPSQWVTTADITLIRRHILAISLLDSAYKVLAGDVNNSMSVTTVDIALIRRMILGVSNSYPAGLWTFVRSDMVFTNSMSPWPYESAHNYTNLANNLTGQDFVAVMHGDVNNSWTAGTTNLAATNPRVGLMAARKAPLALVTFQASNQSVVEENLLQVPILADGFKRVTSVQFSLQWDPKVLQYAGVAGFGLTGLDEQNFGSTHSAQGQLAFSWDDALARGVTVPDGTRLFTVRFKALKASNQKTEVSFGDVPALREVTVDGAMAGFVAQGGSLTLPSPAASTSLAALPIVSTSLGSSRVFSIAVPTERGKTYILECSELLTEWKVITAVVGDGTVKTITDPIASSPQRFYRIRVVPIPRGTNK